MLNYPWDQLRTIVHHADSFKEGSDWSIPFRSNPSSALWYIAEGCLEIKIEGQQITTPQGSVVLLPPSTPFSSRFTPGCQAHHTIAIRFSLLTQENLDWFTLYRLPILLSEKNKYADEADFLRILESFQHKDLAGLKLQTNALVHLFLGKLIEAHAKEIRQITSSKNNKIFNVLRVISWMESHLSEKFTLDDLAALIYVSANSLNHLFCSITNMPPIQYANYLRIQRAKKMLIKKPHSIKEISSWVGINDPLYFSRLFKKFEGVSPSQYRRLMKKL